MILLIKKAHNNFSTLLRTQGILKTLRRINS